MGVGATLFSFTAHAKFINEIIDENIADEGVKTAARAFVDSVADIAYNHQDFLMDLDGLPIDELRNQLAQWLQANWLEIERGMQERGVDPSSLAAWDFQHAFSQIQDAYIHAYIKRQQMIQSSRNESKGDTQPKAADSESHSISGPTSDDIEMISYALQNTEITFIDTPPSAAALTSQIINELAQQIHATAEKVVEAPNASRTADAADNNAPIAMKMLV